MLLEPVGINSDTVDLASENALSRALKNGPCHRGISIQTEISNQPNANKATALASSGRSDPDEPPSKRSRKFWFSAPKLTQFCFPIPRIFTLSSGSQLARSLTLLLHVFHLFILSVGFAIESPISSLFFSLLSVYFYFSSN